MGHGWGRASAGGLNLGNRLRQVRISGRPRRISMGKENAIPPERRGLHDKLSPARGRNQNRSLGSGLRQRVAIQRNQLQRARIAIDLELQLQEVLDGSIGHSPELLLVGLHLDNRYRADEWRTLVVEGQKVWPGNP